MAYRFSHTGNYYVAVNGSDANSGTSPDAPFATIQAALNSVGQTTSQTIVIGTGVYTEALYAGGSAYSGGNNQTPLYLTLQGDGDVVINGYGLSESSINAAFSGIRNGYFRNLTFTNWHNGFGDPQQSSANTFRYNQFYNCNIINVRAIYNRNNSAQSQFYNCNIFNSHFSTTGGQNGAGSAKSHIFEDCMLLNCRIGNNRSSYEPTETFTGESHQREWPTRITRCIIANPLATEPYTGIILQRGTGRVDAYTVDGLAVDSNFRIRNVEHYQASGTPASPNGNNISWTQSLAEFKTELQDNGGLLDWNGNVVTKTTIDSNGLSEYDFSFNFSELTGSELPSTGVAKTLGSFVYGLDFNNDSYFANIDHPLRKAYINFRPELGYGTADTGSNPFHTTGGATWSNIIETGSGFILSSSALISGTIESAVIDQGINKTLQSVRFNWTSNDINNSVISYYTSSQAGFATPYTYQLRYSTSSSDLSSEEYKVFPLNVAPYIDANGSGSGDVNFITGSEGKVKARYLQFKLTLRNDWNGG